MIITRQRLKQHTKRRCYPTFLTNTFLPKSIQQAAHCTFKNLLDKFWSDQEVLYDYKADLNGIGLAH